MITKGMKNYMIVLSVGNSIIRLLEEINEQHPKVVRHGLKRDVNRVISGLEQNYASFINGLEGKDRHEINEQVNKGTLSFEEWADEHFN